MVGKTIFLFERQIPLPQEKTQMICRVNHLLTSYIHHERCYNDEERHYTKLTKAIFLSQVDRVVYRARTRGRRCCHYFIHAGVSKSTEGRTKKYIEINKLRCYPMEHVCRKVAREGKLINSLFRQWNEYFGYHIP